MIPFTAVAKNIKYPGINLAKDIQVLYTENIARWREIKEALTRCKDTKFIDWKTPFLLRW